MILIILPAIFIKFTFRVHCFNNWQNNKQCEDLQISYLIECDISPQTNSRRYARQIQINNQLRSLTCEVLPPDVTFPPLTTPEDTGSTSLSIALYLTYLLTIILLL